MKTTDCPCCGETLNHGEVVLVLVLDETYHKACVELVNADLDARTAEQDDRHGGCPECGDTDWVYADGPGEGCECLKCGFEWDANRDELVA